MKIGFFDCHQFETQVFDQANLEFNHQIHYISSRLTLTTAPLAQGMDVVCAFVNDRLDAQTLSGLKQNGVKLVALRSAGFNHVDLEAAKKLSLPVVRVPEYSPYSVAEHAVALLLTLNRKTHKAYNRVRENNFSLEGLVGFDLHGKKIGIVGTGKIGKVLGRIMQGFGCQVLLHDLFPDDSYAKEVQGKYVSLDELYTQSDVVSLHVPLTAQTKHMINERALEKMKSGVMIINTGRGALIETKALIKSLKTGHILGAGLDVYEEEEGLFFGDHSGEILQDETLSRLMTFPNVLITGHQAFLTHEALSNIAQTTLQSISDFERGLSLKYELTKLS